MKLKMVAISDSPKLHTGFGNVAAQIYKGFNEVFDFSCFGIMDWEPDFGSLPYPFEPVSAVDWQQSDQMGFGSSMNYILKANPDLVFIMLDPGNLVKYWSKLKNDIRPILKDYTEKEFKVIAYVGIEGFPVSTQYIETFKEIIEDGGMVISWSKSGQTATGIDIPYVYFGDDHADFQEYENREDLKAKVGLDKYFVIGSVGTNKRTKGFAEMIYLATHIGAINEKPVKFYCHTLPDYPTMQGYNLLDLAKLYKVSNKFLWRKQSGPNVNVGVKRNTGSIELIKHLSTPSDSVGRRELWDSYDYVSKLNCFDMYLDLSRIEGWGLPQIEALSCGVPLVRVKDYFVRDELIGEQSTNIEPLPVRCWDTWHTGARLVTYDVADVANAIVDFKRTETNYVMRSWDTTRQELNKLILDNYDHL